MLKNKMQSTFGFEVTLVKDSLKAVALEHIHPQSC